MPEFYGELIMKLTYQHAVRMHCYVACITGRVDHLKPVNWTVWGTAMAQEAQPPPPMFDVDFYEECAELVKNQFGIDLNRDVNSNNCVDIYLYLSDWNGVINY